MPKWRGEQQKPSFLCFVSPDIKDGNISSTHINCSAAVYPMRAKPTIPSTEHRAPSTPNSGAQHIETSRGNAASKPNQTWYQLFQGSKAQLFFPICLKRQMRSLDCQSVPPARLRLALHGGKLHCNDICNGKLEPKHSNIYTALHCAWHRPRKNALRARLQSSSSGRVPVPALPAMPPLYRAPLHCTPPHLKHGILCTIDT